MYQLNETKTWREHRRELLRETENGRPARRPKAEHPGRKRALPAR